MTRSLFVMLLVGLAATAEAQNSDFDYSYIELSYSDADYDTLNSSGDGLGINASVAISDYMHVFGGYAGVDVDNNADATGWSAGLGLNTDLSDLMDVVVRLSYQSTSLDVPGLGSVEDDGLGLGAGVRVGANEWIEVFGGLTYLDLDSGNETVFDAGFLLNFGDDFAIGVSGAWDDDVDVWSLNGRLYFD